MPQIKVCDKCGNAHWADKPCPARQPRKKPCPRFIPREMPPEEPHGKYSIERIREYAFGFAQHSEGAQMIAQLLEESDRYKSALETIRNGKFEWAAHFFIETADKALNP